MDGQAVRLKYGVSLSFSPGGGVTGVQITQVIAKLKNLSFAKDVALRYAGFDGTWIEKPLTWEKQFGDYDVFSLDDNTFVASEFVLRYSAAGQTFWDNNGGNYHVDGVVPNTVGGNVMLNKATARRGMEAGGGFTFTTSWVEGEIYVKNLSFQKRVGIRLSTNDWSTFQDTDASFSGNVPVATGFSQVEVWRFKTGVLNLDASAPNFRLAAHYNNRDTGQWHWDNNFGRDYSLDKADLATAE